MRIYATVAVTGLLLVTNSCADAPTRPEVSTPERAPLMKKEPGVRDARLLSNMPVEFPIQGGGTFIGRLTITHFSFDETTRTLMIDGELSGRAMSASHGIMKTADGRPAVIPAGRPVTITNVPVTLSHTPESSALVRPAQQTSCPILFLTLGPIHLDLLGLVLDTSQITIDLTAQPGGGNLLGNLLCALLGLLDPLALIAQIQALLTAINNLLMALPQNAMPLA